MISTRQLGKSGEEIVACELQKNGFTILAYNYHKQYGEIDLIAQKDDLLVFVEVKMRTRSYGDMACLVPPAKQRKIIMVAKEYIARHNTLEKVCRFDVALIEGDYKNHKLTYIENAFIDEREDW